MKARFLFLAGMASLLLLSNTLYAQNRQYHINDCESGRPLSGVKIFNSQNKLLATSDATGGYTLKSNDFPLFYEKGSYNLLQVNNEQELQTACMSKMVRQIGEVVISAKRIDPGDYLLQLRDKNVPRFITHDTTLYYKFTYTYEFPDNHWKEEATGYIAHRWKPHRNVWPVNDYYIQYHYSNTDSVFIKKPIYQNTNNLGLGDVLITDVMGNKDGYIQWDDMAKARKKDHIKLEMSNDSGHIIFKSYYDDSEIGFRLNRFEFDSSGNLLSFTAQAPPGYFSVVKQFKHFDKKQNQRSSYYTKFKYSDVKGEPRVLQSMQHVSSDYNGNLYYKTYYTLELVNEIPKKDFNAPAFGLHNGQMILNYFKEHKGKEDKTLNKFNRKFSQ